VVRRGLRAVLPVAAIAGALATGPAQAASAEAAAATDLLLTYVGIAFLLWIVGNIFTKHHYNTRGPKGEKLPPAQ
jgi:hypothetical protein